MKNWQKFIDGLHKYIGDAIRPIVQKLAELSGRLKVVESRLAAMEKSVSDFRYRGVFEAGKTYAQNNCVSVGGSMWICVVKQTSQRPGDGGDWQLAIKRGKDGFR